jgi:trehalose synthase
MVGDANAHAARGGAMARIQEVHVDPQVVERFEPLLGAAAVEHARQRAQEVRDLLAGQAVWNVNSTAAGGGVAEMLATLLGYPRSAGIDARWLVIEGSSDFFRITKRLHHALHGSPGDGSPLGDEERHIYERVLHENAEEMLRIVSPGDVVMLHDPQTAGLAPHLRRAGLTIVWRCHIGSEVENEEVDLGWAFLEPYLDHVPVGVFSRHAYIPDALGSARAIVVPPSIDPFSAKSEPLDAAAVRAVLARAGLVDLPSPPHPVTFAGTDGAHRVVDRRADLCCEGAPPPWDAPLVVQVSRWDPLKDPVGVMLGFAMLAETAAPAGAHLVLAGPQVTGIADDPEAGMVLEETIARWRELPQHVRARIHLASLPTVDVVENASIVNALQSHATVVVQKSLFEGFGLTVTEAMWKGKAVVASAVGGIQDQIEDEVHGLLVSVPSDLDEFANDLARVLTDDELRERLGGAARERVRERFLPVRHLLQYADLIERVLLGRD